MNDVRPTQNAITHPSFEKVGDERILFTNGFIDPYPLDLNFLKPVNNYTTLTLESPGVLRLDVRSSTYPPWIAEVDEKTYPAVSQFYGAMRFDIKMLEGNLSELSYVSSPSLYGISTTSQYYMNGNYSTVSTTTELEDGWYRIEMYKTVRANNSSNNTNRLLVLNFSPSNVARTLLLRNVFIAYPDPDQDLRGVSLPFFAPGIASPDPDYITRYTGAERNSSSELVVTEPVGWSPIGGAVAISSSYWSKNGLRSLRVDRTNDDPTAGVYADFLRGPQPYLRGIASRYSGEPVETVLPARLEFGDTSQLLIPNTPMTGEQTFSTSAMSTVGTPNNWRVFLPAPAEIGQSIYYDSVAAIASPEPYYGPYFDGSMGRFIYNNELYIPSWAGTAHESASNVTYDPPQLPLIEWDLPLQRMYEVGLDRGVLYTPNGALPWSGLVNVKMKPQDNQTNRMFFDGVSNGIIPMHPEYTATVEAYTYPEALDTLTGFGRIAGSYGMMMYGQASTTFGFSYRTKVGDSVVGSERGYVLHLVYNATAEFGGRDDSSIEDQEDPQLFSFEIKANNTFDASDLPIDRVRNSSGYIKVDSRSANATGLLELEKILYGTDGNPARLPTPLEVATLLATQPAVVVPIEPESRVEDGVRIVNVPYVTGIRYVIDSENVTGDVRITGPTTITALPLPGYQITATPTSWTYDLPPATVVTPLPPSERVEDGIRYVLIPTQTGVYYTVNGSMRVGEFAVTEELTVVANAQSGYILETGVPTSWVFSHRMTTNKFKWPSFELALESEVVLATNLCRNPRAVAGGSWTGSPNSGAYTITRSVDVPPTPNGTTKATQCQTTEGNALLASVFSVDGLGAYEETRVVSLMIRSNVDIEFRQGSSGSWATYSGEEWHAVTFAVEPGNFTIQARPAGGAAPQTTDRFWWTDITTAVNYPLFDGSSPSSNPAVSFRWTGAPNASSSEMVGGVVTIAKNLCPNPRLVPEGRQIGGPANNMVLNRGVTLPEPTPNGTTTGNEWYREAGTGNAGVLYPDGISNNASEISFLVYSTVGFQVRISTVSASSEWEPVPPNTWTRTTPFLAPGGVARYLEVRSEDGTAVTNETSFYYTEILSGNPMPDILFDGSDVSPDPAVSFRWTGTPNDSSSEMVAYAVEGFVEAPAYSSMDWSDTGYRSLRVLPDSMVDMTDVEAGEFFSFVARDAGQVYEVDGVPYLSVEGRQALHGPCIVSLGEGWWDSILWTTVDYLAGEYFDGDNAPEGRTTRWLGEPNESASELN